MGRRGIPWSATERAAHCASYGAATGRFLARVEHDLNGGCWLWSGTMLPVGYGQIQIDGKQISAHRLSWNLFRGEITAGLCVCHRCDVRACVNPDHLFLGTHRDNVRDMLNKGRGRTMSGDDHVRAKIQAGDIPGIWARIQAGERMASIAGDFGVDQCAINAIRRGRTWKREVAAMSFPSPTVSGSPQRRQTDNPVNGLNNNILSSTGTGVAVVAAPEGGE